MISVVCVYDNGNKYTHAHTLDVDDMVVSKTKIPLFLELTVSLEPLLERHYYCFYFTDEETQEPERLN